MAHQVGWLGAALTDLEDVLAHISLDSPSYASVVGARFMAEARQIAEFPRIGRVVPEWGDDNVRERIVYSYRLIYHVRQDEVLILAVIHGARLLPDDIAERRA